MSGRLRRRTRIPAVLVLAGLLVLVAAGCGSGPTSSASVTGGSDPAAFDSAVPAGGATWLVTAMGHLDDPSNTFWQAWTLQGPTGSWVLRTPPGVADNGGLAVASSRSGRQAVVAFRPSNRLSFSPLAVTSDGGRTYATGLLPVGLAPVDDALAAAGGQALLADTATGVQASADGGGTWTAGPDDAAIGAATGCGPGAVTAVALGTSEWVGTSCTRPGRVGLVRIPLGGGTPAAAGPTLPDGVTGRVLRIVADGAGVTALVAESSGSGVRYVAVSDPTGDDAWSATPAWSGSGPLVTTSVTDGGGFAVLTGGSAPAAAVLATAGGPWRTLPAPPAGTDVIAVTGSRVDAVHADNGTFVDWVDTAGAWQRHQTATVAIPYGSSS